MSRPGLEAAFPSRPLTVKAPVTWVRGLLLAAATLVLAGGFGWFAAAAVVPTLLQDHAVRDGAVPVREPHMGDHSVAAMAHPDWLTTDMGQDHLWNRMLTLPDFGLAVAMIALGGLIVLRARRALSGQPLAPVPLRMLRRDQNGLQAAPLEGGAAMLWPLPRKAEPFWLDPALGVGAPGRVPMPLGRELAWADFSGAERARLRAALA